jgi:hypothetical protein
MHSNLIIIDPNPMLILLLALLLLPYECPHCTQKIHAHEDNRRSKKIGPKMGIDAATVA